MGAKHSLMDDLVNFKMTSKQMNVCAKCEKNLATQKAKLKKAIEQKNIEVSIYDIRRDDDVTLIFILKSISGGTDLCGMRYARRIRR